MNASENKEQTGFMTKLATFIVDKRNLVFLLMGIMLVFSLFSKNWVVVENKLTAYLPSTSETRKGLDVMEDQFTTFGSAKIMFANVSYARAQEIAADIASFEGVQGVNFDNTTDHYNNVSALYDVTFDYPEDDGRCLEGLNAILNRYGAYDTYVSTTLGNQTAEIIDQEIGVIMVIVGIIVAIVLVLTSKTFAEVPVLALTFGSAMILNMGTNFLFPKISFVSNSVTSILQLALSLDYAVILCNRFKEEKESMPIREAAIVALSKGIPEIGASSLTTIGGLVAMIFMQFRLGPDMGVCLIKAILYALFSVFVFMPGLLVLFGPLMDKTEHRNLVPKISFVGKFDYATRHVVPIIFAVLIVAGYILSSHCPYVYGYDTIKTPKLNNQQISANMIRDTFTSSNLVALVVPAGDYEKEKAILAELDSMPEVNNTMGLSNIEALDGYTLTDKLTPRQFAELADIDYELAVLVYSAYATEKGDYSKLIGGISTYGVPLIDIFLYVCDYIDQGYVTLSDEQTKMLKDAAVKMRNGKLQLQGEDFSRMLIYLNLPVTGDETYAFTDRIMQVAQEHYPDGKVYVVGESTNAYEFKKSFARDNITVSVMSILIVLIVLLFTFKSAGMPVLLIMVIQGSIWVNFSIPFFTKVDLFFIAYLIVSSIQMGANIDYAIVIASRYTEIKENMSKRDAIIETMNFAFPTILTSGSILAAAGFMLGRISSEGTIVGIGQSICRGTLISIVLVLFVLPQLLLVGDKIIEKTSFSVAMPIRRREASGRMVIDGAVRGTINGTVTGIMHATVEGDAKLELVSGEVKEAEDEEA
ncbi:MAG: MMPL family transporter [Firmicutes bacterium]|nr:MMPL family transporter [Bacillota bacterium]MBR6352133.1 MMPL family transporter [Bacillota bacterium]